MKIAIPKIVLKVSMAGYASELEGQYLHVWVNPPMETLKRYETLVTEIQEETLGLLRSEGGTPKPGTLFEKTIETARRWLHLKSDGALGGLNPKILAWYAEIWSQGPEETRWTVDELQELERRDPTCLAWFISQTWQTRNAHMEAKKKA